METTRSLIQEFYKEKKVLVTGATGFMGKLLVENLLRKTEVKTIYLLIRPKKGKSVLERTEQMFEDVVFSKVRAQVTDYKERVLAIDGDTSLVNLGIREEDASLLQSNVEVIFHGAATVRFDEAFDKAVTINVRGTREVLFLAKKCKHLKAFVHISTAFSNCNSLHIREEFSEPPLTADNAIRLVECLSTEQAQAIWPSISYGYPNTYAYTKAIGEHVVQVYGQGLPTGIVRPAIMSTTAEEPLKGWTDNLYGAIGVQAGTGAGVLRAYQVDVDVPAELVPADMVVNATVASAWNISEISDDDCIPIYNIVSSRKNPIKWQQVIDLSLYYGRIRPLAMAMWYYSNTVTKYRLLSLFYQFFLHTLPAFIVDSALYLSGREPQLMKIYRKIHKFSGVIAYFSTRKWKFDSFRVARLWECMTDRDRELFDFDFSAIDWDVYFKDTIDGLRMYLFKETLDDVPAARRKQFWFMLAHYTLLGGTLLGCLWSVSKLYSLASCIYLYICKCNE